MLLEIALSTALLNVAWEPTGLRWNNNQFPIDYCITANGTNTNVSANGQRVAIENAIFSWVATGAGGNLSCSTYQATDFSGSCGTSINTNNQRPDIFFEDNWSRGSGSIGVTWSSGNGQNCGSVTNDLGQNTNLGCKFDADIEFNDNDFFWTNQGGGTDIQSIAVHEYGHFIGMDHCTNNGTCNIGTGVMAANYPGGQIQTLFNDDVEGACALYPGTQGGLGWPCAGAGDCNSAPICVNAGNNGYCSETCGNCPAGFICDPNPQNPGQNVCLRDDGLNKAQCEICQLGLPGACVSNGICIRGLPSQSDGRCVMPCVGGAGGTCDTNYQCLTVQFQGGGSDDFCFPRSNDCNDPGNFTELQLGQACSGNPPCAAGLECVGSGGAGICAPDCTGAPNSCPANYACADFQGGVSFCLPSVREGQTCDGLVACEVGPCLTVQGGTTFCYRDCAGDPSVCNSAQTCATYTLQGGGSVSICEPPGVPPLPPDAGVADTGVVPGPDGGQPQDTGVIIGEDGGIIIPPPVDAGQNPEQCLCDTTTICDGQDTCACDPECVCSCDVTFSCDPGCQQCDPECFGGPPDRTGCEGCTSSEADVDPLWSIVVLAFLAGLVFIRRRND